MLSGGTVADLWGQQRASHSGMGRLCDVGARTLAWSVRIPVVDRVRQPTAECAVRHRSVVVQRPDHCIRHLQFVSTQRTLLDSDTFGDPEAAQILSRDSAITTGQNRLMMSIREFRMVDGSGLPYQKHIEHLLLRATSYEHPHTHEPVLSKQVRVTTQKLKYLHKRLGGTQPLHLAPTTYTKKSDVRKHTRLHPGPACSGIPDSRCRRIDLVRLRYRSPHGGLRPRR